MSDDRPKKSWREIDRAREKGSTRRDPEERQKEKAGKTAAYAKYKSQLDKLFTPGGAALPEALKAQLGPASPAHEERRRLMDALKSSPSRDTLRAYLDAGHPLPEDPRLLTHLLDIRDEPLLRKVLEALRGLVASGKAPSRMLLLQRLQALENFAEEQETLELARAVRAALG